jgi:hypothetical protein
MRIAPLAVVALTVLVAACSSVDSPTAPSQLRGPSLGVSANSDNAAWVVRDSGACGMPGSDENGNLTFGGIGAVTHSVQNNHKVQITCKGRDLVNLSGAPQEYTGFACGLMAVKSSDEFLTIDSHASVDTNGNGSMQCTWTF